MCQKNEISLNAIEKQFADRFVNRYGILLLTKTDALQMVQTCINENVFVIGIDGFWIRGDKIQPSMADSVDFSSKEQQASYLDAAFRDPIEFLKTRDDRMMFEIICADSPSP